MKWWEKTVEYLFVSKYFVEGIMVAPLDGNEERLSDTILAEENKWVAIEFKRNEESIAKEKDKFIDYEEAKNEFIENDGHHFIIYGAFEERLILNCVTYFSNKKLSIEDALSSGLDHVSFKEYIERYLEFKKPPKDGGGGGLSFENYKLVACITNDGRLLSCMSISEFLDMFKAEPEPVHIKAMQAGI